MGDYLPKYKPGDAIPLNITATVTGGRLVTAAGAHAGANARDWLGVASRDAVNGDRITVYCEGVQRLIASGAITKGDLVVCAAAGAVSSLAAVTTPTAADVTNTRAIVGLALEDAVDTAEVSVKMVR